VPRSDGEATAPSTDDPEALATWFQDRVTRHLEASKASARPGEVRRAAPAEVGAGPPIRVASARAPRQEAAQGARQSTQRTTRQAVRPAGTGRAESDPSEYSDRDIDWFYLQDVFDGRISGIPNERKAGISLREIDELGEIPYVEQLRQEQRYEELRDLGFEDETTPWPACIRKGTCRRDSASSPP
jgi:hypothetical protein